MENNKKNYLFRLGPLVFFPKQPEEEKKPAYLDSFEQYRNIGRATIMLIYGMACYYLIRDFDDGDIFTGSESRPINYYVLFSLPAFFSAIDGYLVWLELKTGIPMNRFSRYMIYGAWTVSAIFYLLYIYNYINSN